MDASPPCARVFRLVFARAQQPAGWGKRDEGEEENFVIAPSERHAAVSQQHPRIRRRLCSMTRILDLGKPRDPTLVKALLL